MSWFKVDDGFWSHPKTLALSPDAVALWVRAGSWSCQQLTDGVIEDYTLPMFGPVASAAGELVEVGYWYRHDGAYEFHDWAEYQEASEAVKDRRKKNADKMRRWREAKAAKADGDEVSNPVTLPVTNQVSDPVSDALPDPTRPDPTSSISNEIEESSLSADESADPRGTLIPANWRPKPQHVDKARSLHLDVKQEYQKFRSFNEAKQRRMKKWDQGFTNWLTKAIEIRTQRQGVAPVQRSGKQSPTDRIAAILAIGEQEGIEA